MSEEKIVYTPCQGWGCHDHCILETHVKDGKITHCERAVIGGPQPDNAICAKGVASALLPYQDDKLAYPLKRVGERGEGKFERISWDQAISEISEKLKEISGKYGPQSIILNAFICGYPLSYSNVCYPLCLRWAALTDCSVMENPSVDKGNYATVQMDFNNPSMYNDERMMKDKDLVLIWGGNPIGWSRPGTTSQVLLDVQENGGRIIDVGIMFDPTAAKADQFIRVNPGTDAAMLLAIARIIIEEDAYDEAFLVSRTVAPFLVRKDNGMFLRESDLREDGDPKKYVFFDRTSSSLQGIVRRGGGSAASTLAMDLGSSTGSTQTNKDFLDDTASLEVGEIPSSMDPDICKTIEVNGIECQTAFLMLKDHVEEWTPEAQEEETGVPAQVVLDLAHEYINTPNSCVYLYYGIRYINNAGAARAISLLPILTGRLTDPAGLVCVGLQDGWPVGLNDGSILFPYGADLKGSYCTFAELNESIEDPENAPRQFKAWLNFMGNPVLNYPNRSYWRDKIFPSMELIVTTEIRMCDTVMFSDYVLPEASCFERMEIYPYNNKLILLEPAIEPVGEALPPADIFHKLADAMGYGEYFDMTTEDWLTVKLMSPDPSLQVDPPITLERLKEEKVIDLNLSQDEDAFFNSYEDMVYNTPSGRVEFYVEEAVDVDFAMASYYSARIHDKELREKYPLQFFNGRNRLFMQGQFSHTEVLRYIQKEQFGAQLNPVTAAERGLKEGDMVEVFSEHGSSIMPLHIANWIPPNMCHTWYPYDAQEYPHSDPPTAVACPAYSKEAEEPRLAAWDHISFNRHAASGSPMYLLGSLGVGYSEVYWDCVCDVRKVEEA